MMLTKIWNDFFFFFFSSKKKKSKEKDFEKGPVKDFLTSLGWVKYGSHRLVEQHPIQFATANHYADFALFLQNEEKPEMIIELKRPAKRKEDKDAAQLEDYMVKEECSFGLLVGEVLEVYFIDFTKPKHRAELITTINFDKDNDDAKQLITLLLSQDYDTDKMRDHCLQQLKLNDAVRYWNSKEGRDNLLSYILESSSLPESLKSKLQSMMSIDIYVHQQILDSKEETDEKPVVVSEPTDTDYYLFKVQMKGTDASIRYYPSNSRYVILAHSLIRKECTDSFKNRAAIAKRNEIISDSARSKDMGESVELLQDVEFITDAPNTPTQFCTARSTNATEALKDENGRSFADVFSKDNTSKTVGSKSTPSSVTSQEDNFKDSCIRRLVQSTGGELIKKSGSTYWSSDGKTGYVFRTSKIYKQGNREKYWYAYKRMRDLANCKNQLYVFGCNDANTIIVLPVSEIESQLDALNYSQDGNGNPSYWHIVFFKDAKGKMTWLLSKPKPHEVDITNKLL